MIVLKCSQPTYFDVDDTLIKWTTTLEEEEKLGIPFEYDYGDGRGLITGTVVPHCAHVQQLIKHAMRGHTIIVWSAGGEQWAAAAVKSLGLEQFVSLCIAKPTWAYDDKKAEEFMKTQYMEDK